MLDPTIVQAALATCAAPAFFERVQIGTRFFVDGGLGANNPTPKVWEEAQTIWDDDRGQLDGILSCILSIGTGNQGKKELPEKLGRTIVDSVVSMATETEKTALNFGNSHRNLHPQSGLQRYFRFNVEQGLQGVGLAEYKEEGTIEEATEQYMSDQQRQYSVRTCAKTLAEKNCMTHSLVLMKDDFS